MPITKIRKEPKVSASNVNVSPGQQLDDALTAIGAALDAKASAADVAAVTGNRSNLDTTDKTNLVAAINEVKGNIPTSYNELTDKPIVKTSDNGFVIVAQGANRANKATAQNAFAEGGNTEATGTSSHAEGFSTLAAGGSAHAEGQGTEASGTGSHAEGYSTLARGAYSHVEGNYTETVDSYAHAEGENTVAYGIVSHAEGSCMWSDIIVSRAYTAGDSYLYVKQEVCPGFVISDYTQTVGVQRCVLQEQDEDYRLTLDTPFTEDFAVDKILNIAPSAYGSYSHIEGSYTVAMGTASHAEGNLSKALGDYSHAEGQATETQNFAEHASGKFNKSTPNVTQFSIGIGADEEHRANAYEVTTDGKMYVKGVGGYDGTNATATGVKALGESGWLTINYADITGAPVRVSQNNGYSLGYGSSGTPYCSFATGYMTTASDMYSHAEGYYTRAQGESSHAEGNHTHANGNYSHAEGGDAQANGNYSHAEGSYTNASTATAHAEGDHSTASGIASHAEGYYTKASSSYSHAEGTNTEASGVASHTEGKKTKAIGNNSHAEGGETTASGKRTHAEGEGMFVQGAFKLYQDYSSGTDLYIKTRNLPNYGETIPQVGYIIQVSSQIRRITDISYQGGGYMITIDSALSGSLSTGTFIDYFTGAVGDNSHSEGYYTNAIGNNSHAEGYSTYAQGDYSHTEGYNTETTNDAEHASGKYNKSTYDVTLFSVGIGTADNARANAFEIDDNGGVYIKGIGGYDGTNITGAGVKSVQEVIAELAQQITTLQGGGNNS